MAITKIILQQMVTMDQNSITASKYPKYTIVLGNTISSITAGELTSAIESSKASAAAAKQSEINAKQSELNAKDSENEAEISAASSQQSATQSASSATASANSAKAAKTSETNAKASETAAKTSETNAKASETAAKTSETNANSSKTAAAASASAAKTSETNASASAAAAKTSETNANNSKIAAANSANAAKVSETNAKTSETNAAASATKAENVASGMKASIGLGDSPRDCPDISGNPSNFLGFLRIYETATGFPSIAVGETVLTGFISRTDGVPSFAGLFVGSSTRTIYSYRWRPESGPLWTKNARIDDVNRLVQLSSETQLLNPGNNAKIIITSGKLWGAYDIENRAYIPLAIGQGGTGGRSASEARTNLEINRLVQIANDQTRLYAGNGTTYIEVGNNREWGVYDSASNSWKPLGIAQGGTGATTAEDARTSIGLGRSSSPTFGYLQLLTENDSAQASSGILSQFLRDTSGAQRARSRIYSEIRGDNKAWLTLHLQSDANTNKYAGLSIDGNFQINGNFIGNAISLSDVATSKVNLQVNRFVQATGQTGVVNHAGTAQIFITDNKNWGAYDNELKRLIALPITQGGTGALTAAEARNNLNVFGRGEYGLGAGAINLDWANVATSGSGFYASQVNPPIPGVTCAGFLTNFAGNYAFALAGRNNRAFIRTTESGVNNEWVELLKQGDYGIGARDGAIEITTTTAASGTDLENGLYIGNGDLFGTPFGVGNDQYIGLLSTNCTKNNLYKSQLAFSYSSGGRMFYRSMTNGSFRAWREVCFTDNPTFEGVMGITRILKGVQKRVNLSAGNTDVYIHNPTSNKYLQLKDDGTLRYSDTLVMLSDMASKYTVGPTFSLRNAGKDYFIDNAGTAASSIYNRLWGAASRPTVWEVGPEDGSGCFFYAQSNTDKSRTLKMNGKIECTTLTQVSDRDLKDNIKVIPDATASLRKMNGYTYTLKEDGMPYAGVIAQEVMDAIPEAVGGTTNLYETGGVDENGDPIREEQRFYSVDYAAVTGLLVQVCRESDNRISKLEQEIMELKSLVQQLLDK